MELQAAKRTVTGKGVQTLRKEGKIPAVVYGAGEETLAIELSAKDFEKTLKEAGESAVVTLSIDGDTKNVLIHEVDVDPVSNEPRHADFYAVKKGQKVEVEVPIEFVGESQAVKEGANLMKVMHALSIEGEATHLPQQIEVDVSALAAIGDQITAGDITLPEGIALVVSPEEVVALASEQKEEEEEAPTEGPDMESIGISEDRGKKEDAPATEEKTEG